VGIKPSEDYDHITGVATDEKEEVSTSDELIMRAIVVSLDGQDAAEVETRRIVSTIEQANELGFDVARMLVEKGADKILKEVQLNRGIIENQGNA
jgi:hydroxymethylbilane synthase